MTRVKQVGMLAGALGRGAHRRGEMPLGLGAHPIGPWSLRSQ